MRKTLYAAAAVAALVVTACSDDDGGNDVDATSEGAGGAEADDSGGDIDTFCDGYAQAESLADAEALTPPAEIADDWDDLMDLADLPPDEARAAFGEMEELFQWMADNCGELDTPGLPDAPAVGTEQGEPDAEESPPDGE
jgi:hypothetical protein